jgi:hypothetical protein
VVATAVAFNDEAKYVVNAAQRSGRVVSTLFICINEYVALVQACPSLRKPCRGSNEWDTATE